MLISRVVRLIHIWVVGFFSVKDGELAQVGAMVGESSPDVILVSKIGQRRGARPGKRRQTGHIFEGRHKNALGCEIQGVFDCILGSHSTKVVRIVIFIARFRSFGIIWFRIVMIVLVSSSRIAGELTKRRWDDLRIDAAAVVSDFGTLDLKCADVLGKGDIFDRLLPFRREKGCFDDTARDVTRRDDGVELLGHGAEVTEIWNAVDSGRNPVQNIDGLARECH